ncbi:hypothetical protein EDB83DRAFT_1987869 [Lactarius deliciosus]|nr:hypothetical protein EDB83DRAFT_1987869 [Lactarius deliciosus]
MMTIDRIIYNRNRYVTKRCPTKLALFVRESADVSAPLRSPMRILSGDSTTKFLLAAALFLAPSPVKSGSSESDLEIRQSTGTAYDTLCSDVMCIECSVDGGTARYILRTLGKQKLGWMAIGFGRNMGDSPMVVAWPSRGADGEYNSVALSQRKAPFEVMPTPDPHPPFTAKLSITDTYVTVENPQIAFTRDAPPDGMQNIIWAFSHTPPGSDDPDAPISIHHKIGRGMLNLTRIPDIPAGPPPPLPPPPPPVHIDHPHPPPKEDHHDDEKAQDEGESHDDENAEDEGESHDDDAVSGGSTAGFVHGALCTVGFLLVLPSGAIVARYARATGSPRASLLHRLLQFGVAGASIAGGTLAYLFMENHGSSMAHKVGGIGLVLLYVVQCAIGSWVHRIPGESRTGAHGALLAGLGGAIVLLAFFETWLGLVSAGRSTLVWSALLLVSLFVFEKDRVLIDRPRSNRLERPCLVRCRRDDGAAAVWICEGGREGRVRGAGHASSLERRTRGRRGRR